MKRHTPFQVVFIILSMIGSAQVYADNGYTFYGAIKASVNVTNDGDNSDLSVSDNSTRVGIKGKNNLKEALDLVYQIELGIDTTERTKVNSGRNSYIGVKGGFGMLAIGQHDTPFKDIRDHGSELFNDTLAGSRSMLSAVADDGGTKLDNRVKNALLYKTPEMSGFQIFVIYSADNAKEPDSPDDQDNDLIGGSIMYLQGPLYIAFAAEQKSVPGSDDLTAVRVAGSMKINDWQFGGVAESSDNGDNDSLTREAAVFNARYKLSSETWVGAQFGLVTDYDGSSDTGATNISLGIQHKLAKTTSVYAVFSSTQNDDGAAFGLSQGGIQDTVTAADAGDNVTGTSVGIVHKF